MTVVDHSIRVEPIISADQASLQCPEKYIFNLNETENKSLEDLGSDENAVSLETRTLQKSLSGTKLLRRMSLPITPFKLSADSAISIFNNFSSQAPSLTNTSTSTTDSSPHSTAVSSQESPKTHRSDSNSVITSGGRSPFRSRRNSSSTSGSRTKVPKPEWLIQYKIVESELAKFVSKNGVHKANVLRLALLPFLRQRRGETTFGSLEDYNFRIKVLKKWWTAILTALKDRTLSGSDRSAYLEAISGILSRQEWIQHQQKDSAYASLLCDTLKLMISKLCVKSIPLAIAAFSGKVLAYSFFWAPGVAPVLLHLLAIQQSYIDRIIDVSFPSTISEPSDEVASLEDATHLIRNSFPPHLQSLISKRDGLKDLNRRPQPLSSSSFRRTKNNPTPPLGLEELYGPWSRRWTSQNSDVFFAFLKHYYTIMSSLLPRDLPWNAHLATPGLIILHASILRGLDFVVHQTINPRKLDNFNTHNNDFNVKAVNPFPAIGTRRRVDQLKIMATLREILHNDDDSVQFYEPYCWQFERILHSVALKTKLYDVQSCIVLADLVEEYLSSLILTHSWTKHRVQIQKDRAIDWEFWIRVIQKMLSSGNCHTEIRAFSFLFNLWENIPISSSNSYADSGQTSHQDDDVDFFSNNQEGVRWNCTVWLLSPDMWKQYFCHWQPLVRSYYQRLLCWRIASIGSESDLLSSILFSNYNSDARALISLRLETTFRKVSNLIIKAKAVGDSGPILEPAPPVAHRKLSIILNPAAPSTATEADSLLKPDAVSTIHVRDKIEFRNGRRTSSAHLHRTNAFDVFDEIAYAYPAMPPPCDTFLPDNKEQQHSNGVTPECVSVSQVDDSFGDVIKKKLSIFRTKGFKRYFSNDNSKSGTGSKSGFNKIRTPRSSMSTPPSPKSKSSSTHVRRNVSYGDLNNSRAAPMLSSPEKSEFYNFSQLQSLTISLVPPPPQLLRARPEISRSKFKFALEYCDTSARKQLELIMQKNNLSSSSRSRSQSIHQQAELVRPRIPFEFSPGSSRAGSLLELYASESDSSSDDGDSSYITAGEVHSPVSVRTQIIYEQDEDVKYWKYAGRALSEWENTVREFEDFIRSRRLLSGVTRLEDIEVPFMVAEIPLRALAA